MQEASTVLAVGGGFQNYITQYKDSSPHMEVIRPENNELEFEYRDVRAFVKINRVDIHSIVEIAAEYKIMTSRFEWEVFFISMSKVFSGFPGLQSKYLSATNKGKTRD